MVSRLNWRPMACWLSVSSMRWITVGKLFIDYLSPLKQQRIRQKVEKLDRLRSRA